MCRCVYICVYDIRVCLRKCVSFVCVSAHVCNSPVYVYPCVTFVYMHCTGVCDLCVYVFTCVWHPCVCTHVCNIHMHVYTCVTFMCVLCTCAYASVSPHVCVTSLCMFAHMCVTFVCMFSCVCDIHVCAFHMCI